MSSISVLAPIKIINDKQFKTFSNCLNSYVNLIKSENVELIVANESVGGFKEMVRNKFLEIRNDTTFIAKNGFVNSVRGLIEKSKNKYIVFFLDDVELLFDEKGFHDSIEVMEKNKEVVQVKFGGGKIYKSNQKQKLEYRNTHTPIKINDNTIWLCDNIYEDNKHLISQWNSITRSDLIKELDSEYVGGSKDWDSYVVEMSKIFINKGYDLKTRTGWLNLRCGLYAWGRTNKTLKEHKELYDSNNR